MYGVFGIILMHVINAFIVEYYKMTLSSKRMYWRYCRYCGIPYVLNPNSNAFHNNKQHIIESTVYDAWKRKKVSK